jgi:hypothetical protein
LGAVGDRFYRNDWSFSTSRCFRKEFRRDIFAFAIQTSSVLVSCFGCSAFAPFPTAGIIGSACVDILEARSIGCILIGSKVGFFLSMLDTTRSCGIRSKRRANAAAKRHNSGGGSAAFGQQRRFEVALGAWVF